MSADSDLTAEVSHVRHLLEQARAELVRLREAQEVREERLAPLELARQQLTAVTTTLDEHLTRLEQQRSEAWQVAQAATVDRPDQGRVARWRSRVPRRSPLVSPSSDDPANSAADVAEPPTLEEAAAVERLRGSPLFDGAWYLERYPMVIESGLSPALHYLRQGSARRMDPGPHFDAAAYHQTHPHLPESTNALLHYLDNVTGVAT